MNKLKELANKTEYETACLVLEVDELLSKVDKEFSLSRVEKEHYYGRVEDYRAGIRYDIGNWDAVKYILWSRIFNLKMHIVKLVAKSAIIRKAREA